MPIPVEPFIGTLHNELGKRLPLIGQRPIVPVVGSKVAYAPLCLLKLGLPICGFNSSTLPIDGSVEPFSGKSEVRLLGRRDQVTRPVNKKHHEIEGSPRVGNVYCYRVRIPHTH